MALPLLSLAVPLLDVCFTCLYLALPLLYLALPLLDVCSTCLYLAVPLLFLPLILHYLAHTSALPGSTCALPGSTWRYLDLPGSTPCFTLQYVILPLTNSALPVSTFAPHALYLSLPLL